jgi:hypothetical protein
LLKIWALPAMAERFMRGDKVIAYYDAGSKSSVSGWYRAVVLGAQPRGNYFVRWEETHEDKTQWGPRKPPTSSVDPEQIRHRTERGAYGGF